MYNMYLLHFIYADAVWAHVCQYKTAGLEHPTTMLPISFCIDEWVHCTDILWELH